MKLEIRLLVIKNETGNKSQFKPNQTSASVGSHSDQLVELTTNPALLKDDRTKNECCLAMGNESPLPHTSSRNTTIVKFEKLPSPAVNAQIKHKTTKFNIVFTFF